MSEITPAYRPFESFLSPSSPEEAFTTAYPRRSSAARRNAMTEGSSSISKMGPLVDSAGCALIVPPLSRPPLKARLPWPAEFAPQTCFRPHFHYSNIEFLRHARVRFRNKYSAPALFLCPPASSY